MRSLIPVPRFTMPVPEMLRAAVSAMAFVTPLEIDSGSAGNRYVAGAEGRQSPAHRERAAFDVGAARICVGAGQNRRPAVYHAPKLARSRNVAGKGLGPRRRWPS